MSRPDEVGTARHWAQKASDLQKQCVDLETEIRLIKLLPQTSDKSERKRRTDRVRKLGRKLRQAEREAIDCVVLSAGGAPDGLR